MDILTHGVDFINITPSSIVHGVGANIPRIASRQAKLVTCFRDPLRYPCGQLRGSFPCCHLSHTQTRALEPTQTHTHADHGARKPSGARQTRLTYVSCRASCFVCNDEYDRPCRIEERALQRYVKRSLSFIEYRRRRDEWHQREFD